METLNKLDGEGNHVFETLEYADQLNEKSQRLAAEQTIEISADNLSSDKTSFIQNEERALAENVEALAIQLLVKTSVFLNNQKKFLK